MIRIAKAEGLKVTCDVNIHHLILDDGNLETFDTNYKVLPPLRTQNDIEALISGVNDGTVDVIVSSHQPYDQDHKKMEFDLADFGIMGAQIVYPLYHKYLSNKIGQSTFINCIEANPKKILKQSQAIIEKGSVADFTLFSNDVKWEFNTESNFSKSDNSPFMGTQFSAKVVGVFKNKHQYLDSKLTNS
jgi:dihydroorotase